MVLIVFFVMISWEAAHVISQLIVDYYKTFSIGDVISLLGDILPNCELNIIFSGSFVMTQQSMEWGLLIHDNRARIKIPNKRVTYHQGKPSLAKLG